MDIFKINILLFFAFVLFSPVSLSQETNPQTDSLLKITKQSSGEQYISACEKLAGILATENADSSISWLKKGIAQARKARMQKEFIHLTIKLGDYYYQFNQYDNSVKTYKKLLTDHKPDNKTLFLIYNKLGDAEAKLGKYDESSEYYREAFDLAKRIDNDKVKPELLNKIAVNQKNINEYEKAFENHNRALELYIQKSDSSGIADTYNLIGSLYWLKGNYDSSETYYKKSLAIKKSLTDTLGIIKLYNNLGVLYKNIGNYDDATSIHLKALQLAHKKTSLKWEATILNYIGSTYLKLRKLDSALHYYHRSLKLRKELNTPAEISNSYNNIALVYRSMEKYDSSLVFFNNSIELRKKMGNQKLIANTYNNIGSTYWKMNEYDKALKNYLESLRIRTKINDQDGIAASYNNIGSLYQAINNNKKALEYYKRSLQIKEEIGNQKDIAYTLHILGNTYLRLNNFDKALEHYQRALLIREEIGDKFYIAQSLHNIGLVYEKLKNKDQALEYLNDALKLREDIGDKTGLSSVLNDLGNHYMNQGIQKKALQKYLEVTDIGKKTGEKYYTALCSRKAGDIYIERNQINKGISYLNYSLDLGYEINHPELIKNAYQSLYKLFRNTNSYKKALDYYIKYSMYKDSIEAQKNNLRIVETQMNYELAQKESQINEIENKVNQLSVEKKLNEIELKKQKNIKIFLFISILFIIIIGVLFYNRYRLKQRTSKLLEEKYEEIKKTNQKLIESEKELKKANATKDKIFSIIAHDLRNPFNALYGLTQQINKNFSDYSSEELKESISLVHNSADALLDLVDNLLYWSRTQRGKIQFNPKTTDLNNIIKKTIKAQDISAREKNIEIHQNLEHKSMAEVDEEMITTVLRNLLSNAIKFTYENGTIKIFTEEKDSEILVAVEDNGIGIEKTDQEKLFHIDKNFSTNGTKQEHGTGLGLILCKEFVDKHNGSIWVESEPGKGSRFIFTLPKKIQSG